MAIQPSAGYSGTPLPQKLGIQARITSAPRGSA